MTNALPANDYVADIIRRLFEQARQAPGTPFEPDRFQAYLTAPPPPMGRRVADSFAGRRRFVRFTESVQLELGVCFTVEEWERGVSLDDFFALLRAKLTKPGVSLRLARERRRVARARLVSTPLKFGIVFLPLLAGAIVASGTVVGRLLALVWACVVGGVALLSWQHFVFTGKLVDRIERRAA